ncbi:LIM/homeobox protein Lhx9 isoform X2 [Lingula anatina]|nr:LIM/homeobox protein Lhx9 isoform X2 [Lingula anatina]|eukprot:XP_013402765.1 LIM/homeobox protein Lhx9 isoform X2 [Lingula anatina]
MPVINAEAEPGSCAGCGGRIVDRYYLLVADRQWHVHCLTCSDCQLRLDSELTCFAKDGSIYCKEDYYRRFGIKRCARCHLVISPNELVMRARDLVYHLTCFTCVTCNRGLTPGDQFGMKDTMIYCRTHYELMLQGDYLPALSPTMPGLTAQLPYYNGVGATQKGRPRKRKSPAPDPDSCPSLGMSSGDNDSDHHLDGTYSQGTPRQKRMRTSFKHHQLRTMKSYFALNHNPDAKDLKQLAQKTGLSKRVLQVWFQNARAKYRRNLLKQEASMSDKKQTDGEQNQQSLTELSTDSRSPPLSEISSTPSLSDLQNTSIEHVQDHSGSASLGSPALTDEGDSVFKPSLTMFMS